MGEEHPTLSDNWFDRPFLPGPGIFVKQIDPPKKTLKRNCSHHSVARYRARSPRRWILLLEETAKSPTLQQSWRSHPPRRVARPFLHARLISRSIGARHKRRFAAHTAARSWLLPRPDIETRTKAGQPSPSCCASNQPPSHQIS